MKEIVLNAKVIPNAKQFCIMEDPLTHEIKIKTKNPAQKDKANQEIVQELKKKYKTNVTILTGHKSNRKKIKIG
ncbi:MAG: DUF167 domain-containing protein [Candidatus Diapherotrites archaeon]|uniref:DUF167 domain-containing protein n=1 Tax=Candidatus Iainarchaeum sp. TaxID=3101447 RepID=A0A8T4L5V5_9ARCH|nr:DUF167 domain-containing protein [Candidatus Diapherotrites archaeon]